MSISSPPSGDLQDDAGPRRGFGTLLSGFVGRPLRPLLERLLRGVRRGALALTLPDGSRLEARGTLAGPHASITLHRWRALRLLLLRGDVGLAQAYRDGDWSTPELAVLLEFGLRNEAEWRGVLDASWPARALGRIAHLANANTRRGSRQNIAFHYDMGNDFYARWLDPELIYSSALYADGSASLEEAQAAKLARILELLALEDGASVLEIGCGWGALALAMARQGRTRVTGLTLSTEQLAHARQRVADEGLDEQVELRLQDYRDAQGQYERIVSVEMLEAVGERYWPVYFETLRQRLAPGGTAVLQVITIADEHFAHYRRGADFIQRFIFPGGMLPSRSALFEQALRAGFTVERTDAFGQSYAATLVEWRRRFLRAWPQIEVLGFDAAFRRLWEYYLCYCEAGFRAGRVDVGLYRLRHA
jgi:cyclopropane-fatty-acyl-phospholipid synthase